MSLQNSRLQSQPALHQVPGGFQPSRQPGYPARLSRQEARGRIQEMTRGVISAILGGFSTKWGRINIKGSERECFFNRSSLLKAEDFEDLAYGREVEFDEESDPNLGTRAVRLTIVRAPGSMTPEPDGAVGA